MALGARRELVPVVFRRRIESLAGQRFINRADDQAVRIFAVELVPVVFVRPLAGETNDARVGLAGFGSACLDAGRFTFALFASLFLRGKLVQLVAKLVAYPQRFRELLSPRTVRFAQTGRA